MKNNIRWAHHLVGRFSKQNILVVGDLMLDRYVHGSVVRISPEAPVPVVRVTQEQHMPGGAANVARNVGALGGGALLSGIVGQDPPGQELITVLNRCGVGTRNVLALRGVRTTVKTRVLAEHQQVVRVDWEEPLNLSRDQMRLFGNRVGKLVRHVDGVIIEDYSKGAIRQELIDAVLAVAIPRKIPVALDPKDNASLRVNGITVATPNRREAFTLARVPETPPHQDPLKDKPLLTVAEILMEQWRPQFLVITLGPQGLLLVARDRPPLYMPTVAREVFDVSGAGDTFVATILLALAAGAMPDEAAELANCASGVVVGKIGTASCTAAELLNFLNLLVQTGVETVHP